MINVYFYSLGGLYFCGKVRKQYAVDDRMTLKRMLCPLQVYKVLPNAVWVVPAKTLYTGL